MRSRLVPSDSALLVPGTTVVTGTLILSLLGAINPGAPRRSPDNLGITRCPVAAEQDLFSFQALQCWFDDPAGRWRILSRVSANGALVVETEAAKPINAEQIARRFVEMGNGRYSEMLVYVQPEAAVAPTVIRRIRWTAKTGFEMLQFIARPMR